MPSQNLPKPNLPGQLQTATQASPSNQATVFAQKPPQVNQSQAVPAGLSRENPGGTPPKMTVSAPANNLAQADASGVIKPAPPTPAPSPVPAMSPVINKPLPTRPASPLDQISLNNSAESKAPMSPSATSPATNSLPQAPASPQQSPANASAQGAAAPASAKSDQPEIGQVSTASMPPTPASKTPFKLPKIALIVGGVLLVLLIAAFIFNLLRSRTAPATNSPTNTQPTSNTNTTGSITTLTYWGLWEDSQILKEVIADFESKNPSIKIDYRKQSHRDYRERLQQAIASGSGPDIFRYHVSWVPMLSADLSPMPASVMSTAEYKQTFYPTAVNNLQVSGQIVGIPLMYDGLALFYNKEMLRTANLDVPKTWAELRATASKLTVPANISERSSGNITRSGLAIGNAGNVDHFSDILALLIIQNGGSPADVTSQYVKDAVTFYTNFIKQDKIWSERLANSTTAFARGDVAMIFAPSWRVHDIKNLNPELDFAVTRVPQLDADNPSAWASFWAEGVSVKSTNKDAAWAFLKYLSTAEVLRKFYNDASQYRAFGEIYPRIDMASELQSDELVGAYLADAPIAKTWYMASFTHDNGLNDQIIKYYEDAITGTLSSTNVEKALETAEAGVISVMSKYGSK